MKIKDLNKLIYNYSVILICIAIFFMYSGKIKFYGDSTLFLILFIFTGVYGAYGFIKSKKLVYDTSIKYIILIILFLILVLTSLYYTPSIKYGLHKWWYTLIFCLAGLSTFFIPRTFFFLNACYILSLAIVLATLINFGDPVSLYQKSKLLYRLGFSIGMHPNILARGLGLSILFIYFYLVLNLNKLSKLFIGVNVFLIIICLFYIYLTGSKGPFIALLISILISFCVGLDGKLKLKRIFYSFFSIIIISLIFVYSKHSIDNTFLSSRFVDNKLSYSLRIEQYIMLWDAYTNFNFFELLFGDGYGSFSKLIFNEDRRGFPHNIFLEVLYELGLIGLIIFFLIVILPFILFSRLDTKGRIYLVIAFYFLINSIVTGDLPSNGLLFVFLCLSIFSIKKKNETLNNINNG